MDGNYAFCFIRMLIHSVHLHHLVAKAFEFDGGSESVEFVEGGNEGLEGFRGAGFGMAAKEAVGACCTFAHDVVERFVFADTEIEHLLADVVVHVVEVGGITEMLVHLFVFGVSRPVCIPIMGDGHADEHHPAHGDVRILGVFAHTVGKIGLKDTFEAGFDVGSIGEHFVDTMGVEQIVVEVSVEKLRESGIECHGDG